MELDWTAIVREYGPLVWKTAYRVLGQEADAADCFQETFVSALEVARKGPVRHWAGLLARLATARALDALRRRVRQRRWDEAVPLEEEVAEQLGPLEKAQAAELGERMMAAVAELPEQQGQVFCLRHMSGMSYEEIGAELGISVDGVGTALFKARSKLRQALGSLAADECGRR
jgi:RNA polymerase sigma-70 factor, ECF subfamily